MPPEVVLVGYYGHGNFGDDVLMIVSHRIAKRLLPGASVALRIGPPTSYPSRLLGEEVQHLPFGTRSKHRLILHGGGGTFFDFSTPGQKARALNTVLLAAGPNVFVASEARLRHLSGRPRMSAKARVGLGIGIGTFSPGSPKLLEALPVLSDFDGLWLRDARSSANLQKLGLFPPVVVGSDLAFLSKDWCPKELFLAAPTPRHRRPKVGVILRDWPTGSGQAFAQSISTRLAELEAKYDLHLFSFDPKTDSGCLDTLSGLPTTQWQPDRFEMRDFLEVLASQDILLTARAHGAICGACLGRPSVLIEIEPKLRAVHAMLPNSTQLVDPQASTETIEAQIENALGISSNQISEDVLRNEALSQRALASILEKVQL